jgi:dTDP-3-amino-2,3,6-trideoxy-4-keto-D-glucose/dTDP-3-amino-3,4,6-trideoxy-alpha-D-glucose/dTDP-2,6-dideoxy-D-kanosamine transaminase
MGNSMIKLNDLGRSDAEYAPALVEAAAKVIRSGWYVLGSECQAFEQEFASYLGVPFVIGMANGTDTLEMSMRAVGVTQGVQVAVAANAGFYACTALLAIGAMPVFVDVDPETHLISPRTLEAALKANPNTKCVVVTHLYGLLAEMDGIVALTKPRGIRVVEDCAQAHGARRSGRIAGTFGDVASFSFYPTKNLGAVGDGGAVCTSDAAIAEAVKQRRQYGWSSKYVVQTLGSRNSRLDEIQASMLRVKLPSLDAANARRRAIANAYSEGIKNPKVKTPPQRGEESVAHLYVVECEARDDLARHLASKQIGVDVHYPVPDHKQPALRGSGVEEVSLPVTERLCRQVLTLPCYPALTASDVAEVVAAVNAW